MTEAKIVPEGMRNPHKGRDATTRAEDAARISRWKRMGWTDARIVREMNRDRLPGEKPYTMNKLLYDLKGLQKIWFTLAMRQTTEWKAELISKHELVMEEAWEAWEKSKTGRRVETNRTAEGLRGKADSKEPGGSKELTVREEAQYGDPTILELIGRTLERIAKLTGCDLQKLALTSPNGSSPYQSLGPLTDVERAAQLAALIAAARERQAGQDPPGAGSALAAQPGTTD